MPLAHVDSRNPSRSINRQDAYASIRAPFEHQLDMNLLQNVVCHLSEDIYWAVLG
jgi:hypothetical protein